MRSILLFLTAFIIYGCGPADRVDTVDTTLNFNDHWEFARDIEDHFSGDFFTNSGDSFTEWETVKLPHTAYIEPLVITDQQWQGTAVYRKNFFVSDNYYDRHLSLTFDAAMHEVEVYLNGEHIHSHVGGYLPFVIDLTGRVNIGEENMILLTVNNEDNPLIPPGKPIAELDFNYFSGIYRNVTLNVKDKLHISDPILADRVAAGGVYVWYEDVSDESVTVRVQTDIQNDDSSELSAEVRYMLQDRDGKLVNSTDAGTMNIGAGSHELFTAGITVDNPQLWFPDNPYLYTLTVQLYENDKLIDSYRQRIGIRTFSISGEGGFVLNGEPMRLRGTNRHQEYPYVGNALSDNAQYRDAYKIKKAGYNFIRTGHYPPAPSFMDAVDELGLLFMNAIPGWQFVGDDEFKENAFRDIRDMIRRDRNHPSVIIWEASLNESGMSREFMERAHEIVNEELPYGDLYTSGWIDHAYDIFIPARQHSRPPEYWSEYGTEKPLFIAEYGDWEYYAHNAGFNQDAFEDLQEEARTSRQLRGDGQQRLAQQALNFQEAYNSNLYSPAFGDANWAMYDYNRGYADDLCACGVSDIFRIPKFTYYFYQSQAGPDLSSGAEFNGPMVYIANYWNDPDFTEVRVFSNTEEIELFLNGESIGRQLPDTDRVSTNLKHPPFTFNPGFESGTLRAVGYINGEAVAEFERVTAGEPAALSIAVDLSNRELKAGVNDLIFVYASVTDENGNVVFDADNNVTFSVEGDAELIGHNPKNAEAGIATILLRAGDTPGELVIRAQSDALESASYSITAN